MSENIFDKLVKERSNVLLDIIKQRRSVRKFNPEPVADTDVRTIIEAATMAPSATNSQNWRFIAIKSEDKRKELVCSIEEQIKEYSALITSQRAYNEFNAYSRFFTFFSSAPLVIAVIKTPYTSFSMRIMQRYGISPEALEAADMQGPSAAIQNMLLAAHALGYGACWMTGPLIAKDKLEKVLNINSPDHLIALIPVGKTEASPATPKRKPIDEIFETI
ncbi:nitroreductase family protein [Endomicrobium proavitum]|uniref:Putative Nitroreductase n=1 Tax=Endomicrobium proavitum TaxID=1408281 RepID=A0A0G3WHU6_9BACT|nr:nitroreductase family protein [Endomicrobium proavitum]AKL97913.1 putative Nitroreductase [Endomicrobium proavitum]